MDKLEKLMKKKKGPEMSDMEKHAKMGVLGELRDMAQQAMSDKLHGLKKVSVMSDSKEGLEKGLAKVQEAVGSDQVAEAGEDVESDMLSKSEDAMMPQPGEEGHEEAEMMDVAKMKEELARLQAALAKLEAGHEEME